MKYLIVDVSYYHFAIPFETGTDIAPFIAALSDAKMVESKGYGPDEKIIPTTENPPAFRIVSADKVTIGDEVETLKAQLADVKADLDTRQTWLTQEREKVAKLKKEMEENGIEVKAG